MLKISLALKKPATIQKLNSSGLDKTTCDKLRKA